jgi:hypothetical protein
MAAKTPSTIIRGNAGSKTLLVASFTDIDDADTWASGLGSKVWRWWFQRTDDPTTQAAAGVAVANSSGTFSFYPAEDNAAGDLFILIDD